MFLFLLIMVLLVPLTLIFFGLLWQKRPPKEINDFYGYRTTRSMKSKESWDYAHRYFGKMSYITGIVSVIFSMIAMFLFRSYYENASIWIISFQMALMILLIFPTEWSLKKHFDKNGRPL